MFPILISIGPFKLYTFALLGLVGFFAGLFVVWKRGRELHFEEKELFDVVFSVLVWMFIGARVGYLLIHVAEFWGNWAKLINFVGYPGWYFPAGLIGASISIYYKSSKLKWDMFQLMDILVTGLVLAQAIFSLGSFLSGVGYGMPTTSFLGLPFVGVYDRRYPVQLWELMGFAVCFGYLWWAESVYRTFSWYRKNRSQAETGFLVSMYFIWWGSISLVSTFFRTPEMVWGIFRFDMVASVASIIWGILLLLHRSGVDLADVWNKILSYFGLGKTRHQKAKEQLSNIRDLLDE